MSRKHILYLCHVLLPLTYPYPQGDPYPLIPLGIKASNGEMVVCLWGLDGFPPQ